MEWEYQTIEDYFNEHPEEEEEFIEEMARLHFYDEPIDYPEDWILRGEAEYANH